MKKLFLTSPHSGEKIAPECDWLKNLSKEHLFRDADLFVDKLYEDLASDLGLDLISAEFNRYVVDLNRSENDIEAASVEGVINDIGRFHLKGLHWVQTTQSELLLKTPMSLELHKILVANYYRPWHQKVQDAYSLRKEKGFSDVYQLDCHSMPSVATSAHADPGKYRPQVVVSDFLGKSCNSNYKDLVLKAFKTEFTEVNYNDPYIGGGITAKYGKPELGQHCIQIELRRDMYMDEDNKVLNTEDAETLKSKLQSVLSIIDAELN
jgi:N-formylglutamate amidohydrolase